MMANFREEIRKRGKLVFTLVFMGFRKNVFAVRRYTLVLAYFFGLSLFLFREVLVRGGVVAFEDLAPFFSQTQFYEFQFSSWVKYTQGVPFRARYNVLFLWPRYLPFLKVSLVLITTLAGFLFFLSIISLFKLTLKEELKKRHFALAIMSSTYALFILLPAKISHFNVIVLGVAFMCLALSLFIKALLETSLMNSVVLTFAAVGLLHLMPSIHTIVLFYAGMSFLAFVSIILHRKLKKTLLLFAIIFLVHAAPYLVYILSVTGSGIVAGISTSVPTSYGVIKSGSVDPLRFGSSAHNSQISKYLMGDWAPPVSIMFLFQAGFCMLSLIKFRKSKAVQMIFSLYLLAFFFALGFKSPISGYVVILKLSELIPFLEPMSTILFQVLRKPQRWLFLETYVRMVLFGLSAFTVLDLMKTRLSLQRNIRKRSLTVVKTFSYILIVLFMVSPFLVYPYNLVFTGDFGGALKPVGAPQGMEEIKKIVDNSNIGEKMVSFPLIGGKKIVEWDGEERFLPDEFYNFYFETPSIEGTGSVSILNQLSVSFGYHLLYNNLSVSTGRYFSQLGVKYIFFHNDIASLANESRRVLSSLQSQTDILLRYQNEEYYLFEVKNQEVNASARVLGESKSLIFFYDKLWTPWRFLSELNLTSRDAVFVDLVSGDISWTQFNSIVERIGNNTAIFLPEVYLEDQDVVLSLLLKEKGVLVKPGFLDLLEFGKNGWKVSPVQYIHYFDYLDKYGVYGEFGATDDVFIASSKKNVVATFNFDVPKKDIYDIYVKLHASDGARVLLDVDGRSDRIEINNTTIYKFIQIFEGNLNKGHHEVSIKKLDKRPLVINLVYVIESKQLNNYINEFTDLIDNRHILVSDKYSYIVDYVSKLSYPKNVTIYYYNGDLYSKNLVFRVKDEIYTPIKAVYSGSFLILDETSSSGDVEPIHLPEENVIRLATLAYVTYIALLWVGLALVIMRAREMVLPARVGEWFKEYWLVLVIILVAVASVVAYYYWIVGTLPL